MENMLLINFGWKPAQLKNLTTARTAVCYITFFDERKWATICPSVAASDGPSHWFSGGRGLTHH